MLILISFYKARNKVAGFPMYQRASVIFFSLGNPDNDNVKLNKKCKERLLICVSKYLMIKI